MAKAEKECTEAFLTACAETTGLDPTVHNYRQWRIGWMAKGKQLRRKPLVKLNPGWMV